MMLVQIPISATQNRECRYSVETGVTILQFIAYWVVWSARKPVSQQVCLSFIKNSLTVIYISMSKFNVFQFSRMHENTNIKLCSY